MSEQIYRGASSQSPFASLQRTDTSELFTKLGSNLRQIHDITHVGGGDAHRALTASDRESLGRLREETLPVIRQLQQVDEQRLAEFLASAPVCNSVFAFIKTGEI